MTCKMNSFFFVEITFSNIFLHISNIKFEKLSDPYAYAIQFSFDVIRRPKKKTTNWSSCVHYHTLESHSLLRWNIRKRLVQYAVCTFFIHTNCFMHFNLDENRAKRARNMIQCAKHWTLCNTRIIYGLCGILLYFMDSIFHDVELEHISI